MKRKIKMGKFETHIQSVLHSPPKIIFDEEEVETSWKELVKKIRAWEKKEQIVPNHRSDR